MRHGPAQKFYTADETLELLQLTSGRIRRLLRDGHLEGTPPGDPGSVERGWRISPRSVEERAARQRQSSRCHNELRKPDDRSELVDELRSHAEDLRQQLAAEREANRENRRIIVGLTTQRIPEITATASPQVPSESCESATGNAERERDTPNSGKHETGTQSVSWWRRVLGS